MKTKSRFCLCLTSLLILISLTSCSGLIASKGTDTDKGRIVLDLGRARAAIPEIEEYAVYLCPAPENRTPYENFMVLAMELEMTDEDDYVPEDGILDQGTRLKDSYEVEPGNWFVLVSANGKDDTLYMGFDTTIVVSGQPSSVTITMQTEEDLLMSPYAPNFSDTLYFMATKYTYSNIQSGILAFIPDISNLIEALQDPEAQENTDSSDNQSLLQESMYAEEDTCFKLSNFRTNGGKLYADVIKASFAGKPDTTFQSNVCIMYITENGVQIDADGTGYFLYTGQGLFDYIDWIFETLFDIPSLICIMAGDSPDPIQTPIVASTPASLEGIDAALSTYDWDYY